MPLLNLLIQALTILALAGLAFYGYLGLITLLLYLRRRQPPTAAPSVPDAQLPAVTVQLPVFDELFVVERLLRAAAALDYPRDRLQIQILDDSNDGTTARIAELVGQLRATGIDVEHIHRSQREGYKAGALNHGLRSASGDFIAIFDADFVPPPDFLRRTVPHFLHAPDLGLLQTRWDHLNDADSLLTGAQALALDKHFVVEQTVRFCQNLFPKFNGTAGIWRRSCLEDAGGWHHDTVCEDLCLSTRALLRGWRFQYLPHVVTPAELPASMVAYKNQQARWAKGSTQCLRKFGGAIWRDRRQSLAARLYALLTMAAYGTSLLLILLLLVQAPLLLLRIELPPWLAASALAGLGQPLLFILSQKALYPDWKQRAWRLPGLLLIAIGLSATISRAVLQAFFGRSHHFVRTPKLGGRAARSGYRLPFDRILYVELALCLYAMGALGVALWQGAFGSLPFLLSCALGFGAMVYAAVAEQWGRSPLRDPDAGDKDDLPLPIWPDPRKFTAR